MIGVNLVLMYLRITEKGLASQVSLKPGLKLQRDAQHVVRGNLTWIIMRRQFVSETGCF